MDVICEHFLLSFSEQGYLWTSFTEAVQLLDHDEKVQQFVTEFFLRSPKWQSNKLIHHIPSLKTTIHMEKRNARPRGDEGVQSNRIFVRMIPEDYLTTLPQMTTRKKKTSSSSSSTTPAPSTAATPHFIHAHGPNMSPFYARPLARRREHAPSRRMIVRRARAVLNSKISGLYDMFVEEVEEINRLNIKVSQMLQQLSTSSSSTTSNGTSSKRSLTDTQLLLYASASGETKEARNQRRLANSHTETTHRAMVESALAATPSYSTIVTVTVALVKEIRTLKTASSQSAAQSILSSVVSLYNPNVQSPSHLPMNHCMYTLVMSGGGRRGYMQKRKLQLSISKQNPLLLQPYNRVWTNTIKKRRPKPDLTSALLFCPPIPLGRDIITSPNLMHGPDGLIISPPPTDPYLPYAPFVMYRVRSMLQCINEQEMFEIITKYFNNHQLNINNYLISEVLSIGGDGAGLDGEISTRQTTHILAYGFLLAIIMAYVIDPTTRLPVVCTADDHEEFEDCLGPGGCGQRVVFLNPNPHSHFCISALGMVGESQHQQHDAMMGPVQMDYNEVLDNGIEHSYTHTDPSSKICTQCSLHINVEVVASKADGKWRSCVQMHGSSHKHMCMLCNTSREESKELSKHAHAYTNDDIRLLRQSATEVRERGGNLSEQYQAGSGYSGELLAEYIREEKYHILVQKLHAQINLGGTMMLDVLTLAHANDSELMSIQKKHWNVRQLYKYRAKQKEVKLYIAQHFSTHLNLRNTAKLSRLTIDPSNHVKLVETFVNESNPELKSKLLYILNEFAAIMAITGQSHVDKEVVAGFKDRCVVWSDFLDATFPTLPWPRYMHFLIAHGQEMMEVLGSIGFWCEQSSEHANKAIKYALRHLSRSNSKINALTDTIGHLWDRRDPMVRALHSQI